jgi:hypothetical protein
MKITTEFTDRTENNGDRIPDLPDVIELTVPDLPQKLAVNE